MKETVQRFDSSKEFFTEEKCFVLELSNTPDDPDVSVARVRVLPGVTTRWHRLRGTAERYIILSGAGLVEVGDLAPQEVRAGDAVRIPPSRVQRIKNTGEQDLIFLAVCSPRFTPDVYEDRENPGHQP